MKSRDARPVRPHSNKVLTEVQKNKIQPIFFRQKNKRNKRNLRLKSRDARPVRPHSNEVLTEVQKNKRLLINHSLCTFVLMSKPSVILSKTPVPISQTVAILSHFIAIMSNFVAHMSNPFAIQSIFRHFNHHSFLHIYETSLIPSPCRSLPRRLPVKHSI